MMTFKRRDILLIVAIILVILLLLLQVAILIYLQSEPWSEGAVESLDKGGEFHRKKQEQYQKPGKLIPNPQLPQWSL